MEFGGINDEKKAMMAVTIVLIAALVAGCTSPSATITIAEEKNSEITVSNMAFAFNIFRQLNGEDSEENVFISPLSISSALAITLNGARNDTQTDMETALSYSGLSNEEINSGLKYIMKRIPNLDEKVEINIANSIWIREGLEVNSDFISKNEEVFDAYVNNLDFSQSKSADTINGWIKKATNGLIPKMIDGIPSDVVMYLINAIYFNGEWTNEFNPDHTYPAKFNSLDDQKIDIEMMSRKGEMDYWENDIYQVVRLPYGDEKVSMYCILPKEDQDINEVIASFDQENWNEIKENITVMDEVELGIPKFKMEYGIKQLNDSLSALGMASAFEANADFSGITDGIFISKVLHKAVIEVDEKGTEAAAVTVVVMEESAVAKPESVQFIADRPFMFVIADDVDGNLLFMGKKIE